MTTSFVRNVVSRWMAASLVTGVVMAGGCAGVKPWERATLSDPIMRPDRDPLASTLAEHGYFSREAISGGSGVGGGGCGCN